mmetsp:Transcript_6319/g.18810  ORF Transcript_6319/g.18810 Transcript_6319/m.18810 type:complete len:431 (-) Transcript_6319:1179-2471(-)
MQAPPPKVAAKIRRAIAVGIRRRCASRKRHRRQCVVGEGVHRLEGPVGEEVRLEGCVLGQAGAQLLRVKVAAGPLRRERIPPREAIDPAEREDARATVHGARELGVIREVHQVRVADGVGEDPVVLSVAHEAPVQSRAKGEAQLGGEEHRDNVPHVRRDELPDCDLERENGVVGSEARGQNVYAQGRAVRGERLREPGSVGVGLEQDAGCGDAIVRQPLSHCEGSAQVTRDRPRKGGQLCRARQGRGRALEGHLGDTLDGGELRDGLAHRGTGGPDDGAPALRAPRDVCLEASDGIGVRVAQVHFDEHSAARVARLSKRGHERAVAPVEVRRCELGHHHCSTRGGVDRVVPGVAPEEANVQHANLTGGRGRLGPQGEDEGWRRRRRCHIRSERASLEDAGGNQPRRLFAFHPVDVLHLVGHVGRIAGASR